MLKNLKKFIPYVYGKFKTSFILNVLNSPNKQLNNIIEDGKKEREKNPTFVSDNFHHSHNSRHSLSSHNSRNNNHHNHSSSHLNNHNSSNNANNIKTEIINPNSYVEIEKSSNNNSKFYSDNDDAIKNKNNVDMLAKHTKLAPNNIINNIIPQMHINPQNEHFEKNILFNADDNSYVIMNNNNIECTITNNNVIDYIFNINSSVGLNIKKYIFIISKNEITLSYEFNFINTIFTNDLDIMIKLMSRWR